MTTRKPPRVALLLLEALVPEGACLAGDLAEEYQRGRSRGWLWWQVLAAIAIARRRRADEIRPLRLVDLQPADAAERARRASLRFKPVSLAASPVNGVGGLAVAALALLMTLVMPAAWWLLLGSYAAGIVLGGVMIARERMRA